MVMIARVKVKPNKPLRKGEIDIKTEIAIAKYDQSDIEKRKKDSKKSKVGR